MMDILLLGIGVGIGYSYFVLGDFIAETCFVLAGICVFLFKILKGSNSKKDMVIKKLAKIFAILNSNLVVCDPKLKQFLLRILSEIVVDLFHDKKEDGVTVLTVSYWWMQMVNDAKKEIENGKF